LKLLKDTFWYRAFNSLIIW